MLIFSFSEALPTLYIVASVPTKTSLAANEATKPIPIFQSYPRGLITGSIVFPTIPMYECSRRYAAILSSRSDAAIEIFSLVTISLALLNFSPGP